MSLVFLGRVGKTFEVEDGKTIEKEDQQFVGGVLQVVEEIPIKGKRGFDKFTYSFKPKDIGSSFEFKDEDKVLKNYPQMFKKA